MELGHHLDRPFALFGHSLGAILAFEVARRIRHPGLAHLFVSGRRAPHVPLDRPPIHDLPDSDLADELRRLAGTPEEVLREPEFASVFMPLIRADFRLSETYLYRPSPPLRIPITAYGGIDDAEVASAAVEAWSTHTTGACRRAMFPGGHFFIAENPAAVFADLVPELETIAAGA
jgi:surfactin synthase thioesterase subunit